VNIFVGNLVFTTTEQDLRQLFEPYGTVETIRIMTDRETGRSRGFGFVEMPDGHAAHSAIDALNGTPSSGHSLTWDGVRDPALAECRPDVWSAAPRGPVRCRGLDHPWNRHPRRVVPRVRARITAAGVMGHPCAQHRHGRDQRSRRLRELVRGLDRTTVRGLVVDDDRGARVELVPDLPDFGREWDLVEAVVGALARAAL
jgi:hypothetical protein